MRSLCCAIALIISQLNGNVTISSIRNNSSYPIVVALNKVTWCGEIRVVEPVAVTVNPNEYRFFRATLSEQYPSLWLSTDSGPMVLWTGPCCAESEPSLCSTTEINRHGKEKIKKDVASEFPDELGQRAKHKPQDSDLVPVPEENIISKIFGPIDPNKNYWFGVVVESDKIDAVLIHAENAPLKQTTKTTPSLPELKTASLNLEIRHEPESDE